MVFLSQFCINIYFQKVTMLTRVPLWSFRWECFTLFIKLLLIIPPNYGIFPSNSRPTCKSSNWYKLSGPQNIFPMPHGSSPQFCSFQTKMSKLMLNFRQTWLWSHTHLTHNSCQRVSPLPLLNSSTVLTLYKLENLVILFLRLTFLHQVNFVL